MNLFKDYLDEQNFHPVSGNRIDTSIKINPEKFYRTLKALNDKVRLTSRRCYAIGFSVGTEQWKILSPVDNFTDSSTAQEIFQSLATKNEKLRESLANLVIFKQQIQSPTILQTLPDLSIKLVQPVEKEMINQADFPAIPIALDKLLLEEITDFTTLSENVVTLKKTLTGTDLLNSPYKYQIYLSLTSSEYLSDLLQFLKSVNDEGFQFNSLTEKFQVYSDIYSLYSKDEFMAELINKRIRQMGENTKQSLESNDTSVPRMPIFKEVHRSVMTTVTDVNLDNFKSILCDNSDYCITDKADGKRAMLFIDSNGQCYLIGFGWIKSLDLQSDIFYNCLFDGELVDLEPVKQYLIFDCLFFNNRSLIHLPLFSETSQILPNRTSICQNCRYNYRELDELCTNLNEKRVDLTMLFDYKNYYYSSSCQGQVDLCRKIYQSDLFPYSLDGLIFTNYQLNVPEMIRNRLVASLRWKPIEYLSIDVLVRLQRDPNFPLKLEYQTNENQSVKASLYGRNDRDAQQLDLIKQIDLPVSSDEFPVTLEGDQIYDQTVIEFTSMSRNNQFTLVPFRSREEKTKLGLYNWSQKIQNVITMMQNPIDLFGFPCKSTAFNCSTIGYQQPIVNPDYYFDNPYKEFINRNYMRDLLTFNNIVKFNILRPYTSSHNPHPPPREYKANYLDLACGRANDLAIWRNQINYYLGIDLDANNIATAQRVARQTGLDHKYQFVQGDLTQRELKSTISRYIDSYFRANKKKFNVISLQFAIHYLTDSEQNIRNLCDLCSSLLYQQGYFIFTGFDGQQIYDLLKDGQTHTVYSEQGDLLWKLEAEYPPTERFQPFGQDILFTMQSLMGFRPSHEYLINYEYLTKLLTREYGFKLIKTANFNDILDNQNLFDQYLTFIQQNNNQPKYRDINRQKMYQSLSSQPHLYNLLKLYRFAIFQRL